MTEQPEAPGVAFGLELKASIETLAAEVRKQRQEQNALSQAIYPIPNIVLPQLAATGTLDNPELAGPRSGQCWDVKRITASTFTGGTVAVYLNEQADQNQITSITSAGSQFFSSQQLILRAGDRLVFVSASQVGSLTISLGVVNIDARWLGAYLL